ncbi:MAG: hypothetical protein NVSMB64_17250 [Candidatus Velthaea sp.]
MNVRTGLVACSALVCLITAIALPRATRAAEANFDAAIGAAMARMDAAMSGAPMTGEPDRDFIAMMLPHHAGALEMAEAELTYGHDPRLRRLAQEIIVTQQSEIDVMRSIRRDLPSSRIAPQKEYR